MAYPVHSSLYLRVTSDGILSSSITVGKSQKHHVCPLRRPPSLPTPSEQKSPRTNPRGGTLKRRAPRQRPVRLFIPLRSSRPRPPRLWVRPERARRRAEPAAASGKEPTRRISDQSQETYLSVTLKSPPRVAELQQKSFR